MFNIRIHYVPAVAGGGRKKRKKGELRQHAICWRAGRMESDSAEKADTQRGSCYSHLLASVSAALSGPLIQAAPVIS